MRTAVIAILTNLHFAISLSSAKAATTFEQIFCREKGYTAKTLEIRTIGDRILFQVDEPHLVADHPQVSSNVLDFDLAARDCQLQPTGRLTCASADGILRHGLGRGVLKKITYHSLNLTLEPTSVDQSEKGNILSLRVGGGDLSGEFTRALYFETKITGDSAFMSFCKLDGKLMNE